MLSEKIEKMLAANNGELEKYAWPGGYPIFYLDEGSNVICHECAQKEIREMRELGEDYIDIGELPADYDANYEDAHLSCDDCSERIPSAYAEDEHENGTNNEN